MDEWVYTLLFAIIVFCFAMMVYFLSQMACHLKNLSESIRADLSKLLNVLEKK
jgi:hypothetical protein